MASDYGRVVRRRQTLSETARYAAVLVHTSSEVEPSDRREVDLNDLQRVIEPTRTLLMLEQCFVHIAPTEPNWNIAREMPFCWELRPIRDIANLGQLDSLSHFDIIHAKFKSILYAFSCLHFWLARKSTLLTPSSQRRWLVMSKRQNHVTSTYFLLIGYSQLGRIILNIYSNMIVFTEVGELQLANVSSCDANVPIGLHVYGTRVQLSS